MQIEYSFLSIGEYNIQYTYLYYEKSAQSFCSGHNLNKFSCGKKIIYPTIHSRVVVEFKTLFKFIQIY